MSGFDAMRRAQNELASIGQRPRVVAEVSLSACRYNIKLMAGKAESKGCKVLFVMKVCRCPIPASSRARGVHALVRALCGP